jgi:hypothetical protein
VQLEKAVTDIMQLFQVVSVRCRRRKLAVYIYTWACNRPFNVELVMN